MPLETTIFDVRDHLRTPEERAAYVEAALETDDPSFIALALGDIARARGVAAFAEETGVSRETIDETFRPGGNPTLDALGKVTRALGLRLSVVAVARSAR